MKTLIVIAAILLTMMQPTMATETVNQATFASLKQTVLLDNGISMSYVAFGDPKGEPILLLHGFTDNARSWSLMLPYLNKRNRIIAVDLRGHGKTTAPDCCYAFSDLAYDIKLFMDKMGIANAHVIGHSLRSIVAQVTAESYPERVNKVVLISSTSSVQQVFAEGGWLATEIQKLDKSPDPNSQFMNDWYANEIPVNETFLKYERAESASVPLPVWRGVLAQGQITNFGIHLNKLKAPVLILYGAHDTFFDKAAQAVLRTKIKDNQYVEFSNAGHNLLWEEPENTAAEISKFLEN